MMVSDSDELPTSASLAESREFFELVGIFVAWCPRCVLSSKTCSELNGKITQKKTDEVSLQYAIPINVTEFQAAVALSFEECSGFYIASRGVAWGSRCVISLCFVLKVQSVFESRTVLLPLILSSVPSSFKSRWPRLASS
jgi:hypothetical protein